VSAHQAIYPVAVACSVLGLSRSGYYAFKVRPASARSLSDEVLLERIRRIHTKSRETYGAPRVQAELAADGVRVGCKRVARLMRSAGLRGVSRRRETRTTIRSKRVRPAADLVDRNFSADAPDQLWVADITFVPTWAGFIYLAVVLDAWSRRIVGWAISTNLRTKIVLDALDMAVGQRRPVGVIHHSDQGSQYTSVAFGQRCRTFGVRPSVGSVGDAYDNAMCESFFATLETELIDRSSFRTRVEARLAIFDFIEGFYNPRRRHSGLDYLSPIEYERRSREVPVTSSH
jgi:putative transposase